MTGALREYRAIWRVTMAHHADRGFKVMVLMGAMLTLGATVLAGTLAWDHKLSSGLSLRFLCGIAAIWLLLAWAVMLVPRAVILNSAVAARLMPRQRRRLIQMVAGGWLLAALLATAVAGNWIVLPLAGMFALGLGMIFSGNMSGLVLIVLPTNWPLVSKVLLPPALVEALGSGTGLLAASALVVLGAAQYLRRMFPAGGDRHLDKRARQIEHMQRMRGGAASSKSLESGTVSGASVLRLYAAALRRDCGHGRRAADPGRMLMHALGPAAHWSFWVFSVVIVLVIGVVAHFLVAWRFDPSADRVLYIASGSMGGMVSMILMSTMQIGQSITRTAGEQALLRLTPLAGDKRHLNRRLAQGLLRHTLLVWAMLTTAILVVNVLIFGTGGFVRQAGWCCLAGQVAMHGVLGDYAGKGGGWTLPRVLAAGLLALLETGIASGVGWLSGTPFEWWMIAIAVAGTAFQLQRAWHRMLAAPPAFPARRMALS